MHKAPQAPKAMTKPHNLSIHGDTRVDNYFWLKDRENPEVIKYLEAENKFTAESMKDVKGLEEELFKDMKSRIKEDESSFPVKKGNYYYQVRYEVGAQYPLYTRTHIASHTEEVLLNIPEMAKGHNFYQNTSPKISPNEEWMAYGVDTVGRRFYTVSVKNLKSGEVLSHQIKDITPNFVWAADNQHLFYAKQNPDTLRSEKIFRFDIKTGKEEMVYFEADEIFSAYVYKSLSEKFIFIGSASTLTSEVHFLDAHIPLQKPRLFLKRKQGHEYSVTDGVDKFYILSNDGATNFRVFETSVYDTDRQFWKEIIPHNPKSLLQDMTVFEHYIALEQRENGLTHIRIYDRHGKNPYSIPFTDQSYLASIGDNREYQSHTLRYNFESLRLPDSIYDFNMKSHTQELKKVREVPNYNAEKYVAERVMIESHDGVKVPVSILRKKDFHFDSSSGLLIYGYGSYGATMEPWFHSDIFSLVDRGFVYAIAHIRGGSEMGREWFDTGRQMHKKNTFLDFIACTEGLLKMRYASPKRVFAMGGSAGGLLMGAITNMRPDLYTGIVAQVPFVDVVTTMLDETIPLTTGEYEQWGNPNETEAYKYILSYSPYDNVVDAKYPNMLITTGLHDSQVQYWEPAKWVAKLRDHNKGNSLILMKTNMDAGHGGASGRFERLREEATEMAFILMIDKAHQH